MKLTLGQIADWIHADGEFDTTYEALGYGIDSRTIGAGELFFAVRGEWLDGHEYVRAALSNGAAAAVVSNRWIVPAEVDQLRLLRVADGEDCVLRALQQLAHAVRRAWGGRVIGVTGSAGKTTTKEAVAQVLSARCKVLKSAGNLNNGFGMPLQLLKLERDHEVAVLEMGMNHAGEIAALAKIAEPNWAVVSNVGPVHLEFFEDGLAGVARAKYELIEALPEDGIAVLNFDDPYVAAFGRTLGKRAVFYGMDAGAEVRAVHVAEAGLDGVVFTVEAHEERASVQLNMLGRHNVSNALAAIAVGLRSGVTLEGCATALGELRAGDKRGEVFQRRDATVINDCYNSNPRALDAMVDALLATAGLRHIAVAGEMLELGDGSETMHAACGRRMAGAGVDMILGVRGAAEVLVEAAIAAGAQGLFVPTPEEAGKWLLDNVRAGDVVLLKASRGVRLERALSVFTEGDAITSPGSEAS
ncbi:MAG: UDP-N-acetylmuramoyl-tripeptide--D-alanyl-D-alanine ligase [Acidobacteriota bacterium]|nr:UDP-N-acetylmuramoyl-tripeptide--D-alanyl-D-alanine ligase [Acidobacteriota bacterium]